MRTHIALSVALTLVSSVAFAETTKPATGTMAPASPGAETPTGSSNPAINTGTATETTGSGTSRMVAASGLEKGANSFTEGEARARLERSGLSNVSGLKKDDLGIWRGKAMHSGKSVSIGLDYKGNIAAE